MSSVIRFGTFLRERFGQRVQRVSLHAGMTCPNRDGNLGTDGCIYCDNRAFHSNPVNGTSISDQMNLGMQRAREKYRAKKYLAYFQTFTNTYAHPDVLRALYSDALAFEHVVGLMVATRPDCLDPPIIALLEEFSQKTMVWVELGVQTMHDQTLLKINRGHTLKETETAFRSLEKTSVMVAAHAILGLPGETREQMIQTAEYLCAHNIQAIKLHNLHAVKGTELERMYLAGEWTPLNVEEYIDCAAEFLSRLPNGVISMRLVSDCPDFMLVAPR
jgi:uncharacterized protein